MSVEQLPTPWLLLPAQMRDLLAPQMAEISQRVIRQLPIDVPEYARPFKGRFGAGVHKGVETALARFALLPGTAQHALTDDARRVYSELGRGEVRMGRRLDALLGAYRSGARTTFRAVSQAAIDAGYSAGDVAHLGEAILAYIEEISAASVEGYALEQSARAGERDRLRTALADLLVRGQADEESVRAAATAAGWSIPQRVVAVFMPSESAEGAALALGPTALVLTRQRDVVFIAPAPRSRKSMGSALGERAAVVGPERDWPRTHESVRLATAASEALRTGDDTATLWVADHVTELILAAEPSLVADLAARRLAPLAALPPVRRARLEQTLLSWLKHDGRRAPIAAELSIHEQTVGYRITQLRELFGSALDDPDARFDLELVLRSR